MRKLYQTEWQGISFRSFATLSSKMPATAEFYSAFYREIFKRYSSWDQLPADWRNEKEKCARFLLTQSEARQKVLSVGCGLGAIEHYLRTKMPEMDLHIHDVAPEAWEWIRQEIPDDHKFVGWIPECLPAHLQFDLIYLSAVDYVLDDAALTGLLTAIRSRLKTGGRCLLISASFEATPRTVKEIIIFRLRQLKQLGLTALDLTGLRHRGQFWGWVRTADEYCRLMRAAGYGDIRDGCIDPTNSVSYWIAGRQESTSPEILSQRAFSKSNE